MSDPYGGMGPKSCSNSEDEELDIGDYYTRLKKYQTVEGQPAKSLEEVAVENTYKSLERFLSLTEKQRIEGWFDTDINFKTFIIKNIKFLKINIKPCWEATSPETQDKIIEKITKDPVVETAILGDIHNSSKYE